MRQAGTLDEFIPSVISVILVHCVSYTVANATSDSATPGTQTTVAEHAEELRISEFSLSKQADLIRCGFHHSEDVERAENFRFSTVPRATQFIGCVCID